MINILNVWNDMIKYTDEGYEDYKVKKADIIETLQFAAAILSDDWEGTKEQNATDKDLIYAFDNIIEHLGDCEPVEITKKEQIKKLIDEL